MVPIMKSQALDGVAHYLVTDYGLKSNSTDQRAKEYTRANGSSKTPKYDAYPAPGGSRTDMTEIYHFLATLYRNHGALDDAKAVYQKILRFKPEDQAAKKALTEIEGLPSLANPRSSVP